MWNCILTPAALIVLVAASSGGDRSVRQVVETSSSAIYAEVDGKTATEPEREISWIFVSGVISLMIFAVGGDLYAYLKAISSGAFRVWRQAGLWVDTKRCCAVFIPKRVRRDIYMTFGQSGYRMRSVGSDPNDGRVWGTLFCVGGKHKVGDWCLRPHPKNRNRFELWIDTGMGNSPIALLKPAT